MSAVRPLNPDAMVRSVTLIGLSRMYANPTLLQFVGDFSLLLSNNSNTGGTCFGDSGGPNFVGDSSVVGGVTSFGKNLTLPVPVVSIAWTRPMT